MEKKLTCEEIVAKLDYMKRFLEMSSEEVVACIGDCVNLSQENVDYYLKATTCRMIVKSKKYGYHKAITHYMYYLWGDNPNDKNNI